MAKSDKSVKQDTMVSVSALDVSPILKEIYATPFKKKKNRKRFGRIESLLDPKKGNR